MRRRERERGRRRGLDAQHVRMEARRSRAARELRHELAHVFVRETGGRDVPGWLNEGLCQWLEDASELLPGDASAQMARGIPQARAELAQEGAFPLDALMGSLIRWDDADEVQAAYAQALLLVDAIASGYGLEVVLALVEGCARGEDPAVSFERKTRVPLGSLCDDLARELGVRPQKSEPAK